MATAIQVEGLRKQFKSGWLRRTVNAVDGIDFTVNTGSVVAFVGPNGAGKTTTIYMMLGLLRPTTGTIRVLDGNPVLARTRRHIGYQSEIFYTYRFYTARDAMWHYGRMSGVDTDTLKKRVPALLERVGLADADKRKVSTYSKGMVQRLGIAQSILHSPRVLILDEPTTGLDPSGRRMILEVINEEKEKGTTVFLSSHILADVEKICDQVFVIKGGRIVHSQAVRQSDELAEDWTIEVIGWNKAIEAELDTYHVLAADENVALLTCSRTEKYGLFERLMRLPVEIGRVNPKRESLEELYMKLIGSDHA